MKKKLSKSGWVASDITQSSLWLDYEGKTFKRGQKVLFFEGRTLWDWPEQVPPSIKKKVLNIFLSENRGH